jgi:hypothetical protein
VVLAEADYPENPQRPGRAWSGRSGVFGGVPHHADLHERQRREAARFYEALYRPIRKAERLYLFGPGQAKRELHKSLCGHKDFQGRITAVESADKMSEAQMIARVKEHFGLLSSAA